MLLYRYFKGHDKRGFWKPVKAGTAEEVSAYANSAHGFCTVLAVGSEAGNGTKLEGRTFYSGPFYIDIDADEIKDSIAMVRRVLKQMVRVGVPEDVISVWLSGKRGFHIEVPQAAFTDEPYVEGLPRIWRELARAMGLGKDDLDWSVYSQGKGRMWRIPSRKRRDTGTYKVACTVAEAVGMTPKTYAELVSKESRDLPPPTLPAEANASLQALYTIAVQRVSQVRPMVSTVIDTNLKNALGEEQVPPCVQQLMADENIREGVGFNQKSVQMMKAVRAFVPAAEQRQYLEDFATNSSGESYSDRESRLNHVHRSFGSVASGRDYAWSCRSILSTLKDSPCETCPISFIRYKQEEEEEEEYIRRTEGSETDGAADATGAAGTADGPETATSRRAETGRAEAEPASATGATRPVHRAPTHVEDATEGLVIHGDCYAFLTKEGFRRVTNFVIKITKVFIEHVPSLNEDRRVAVQAEVYTQGRYAGLVNIEEEAWNSSSAFTAAFNGIGNLTYFGKDEEVKRMKSSLLNGVEKKAINIRRVHSYGIHHGQVGGQDVFTYVEPGWSLDNFGNENLYSLAGRMTGAPRLRDVEPLRPGQGDEELKECFELLFSINQPSTVATLLGWNMASFLKQHVFAYRNEFPVLSLWGNAQAGKTQTSGLFAALHGIHYLGGSGDVAAPLSLGGSGATTFAVWTSLSESMTVPKLVEEFNERSLGRKYEDYVETFKRVFNQHSVKRGTIRNNRMHGGGAIDAYTVDIFLTSPTLLISEQSIRVPALVQRCIQVQMNEDQRRGPGMEESFHELKRKYTYFDKFAKTTYMDAIGVSVKQVEEWINEWWDKVPTVIGDRPHFAYCVCLAGLSYLMHLSDKYALGITDKVKELADLLVDTTNMSSEEIAQRKSQSEADRVMQEFAVMSELSAKQDGYGWLSKGQYYVRDGDDLYIDGIAAHAQYLRFAISQSQQPIIPTYQQFRELIRHTRYCESITAVKEGFARNRPVLKFNIRQMAERGIEVSCFEE